MEYNYYVSNRYLVNLFTRVILLYVYVYLYIPQCISIYSCMHACVFINVDKKHIRIRYINYCYNCCLYSQYIHININSLIYKHGITVLCIKLIVICMRNMIVLMHAIYHPLAITYTNAEFKLQVHRNTCIYIIK